MKLPYGISHFGELRREEYAFVDKSRYIRLLEDEETGGPYLLFVRPRRFGKSLLVSMLERYYDIGRARLFDALFGGLDIGRDPTPEHNTYLTLRIDLTGKLMERDVPQISQDFLARLKASLLEFFVRYRQRIPALVARWEDMTLPEDPAELLRVFLQLLKDSPDRLYLLVDDYDNFPNDLVARGSHELYQQLVRPGGLFCRFDEAIREAAGAGVVARSFITGMSVLAFSDLRNPTSRVRDLSLSAHFNAMAGFTRAETETLVENTLREGHFHFEPSRVFRDLERLYGGYRFAPDAPESLYNPDMVVYFLKGLEPPNEYPEQLMDLNLHTDASRFRRVMLTPEGVPRPHLMTVMEELGAEGAVEGRVMPEVTLETAYERPSFLSRLFYMGLLSRHPEAPDTKLVVPNYVIRQLFWESFSLLLHKALKVDVSAVQTTQALHSAAYQGDVLPFLKLVQRKVLPRLGKTDLFRLDERTVKFLLLGLISQGEVFTPVSELEGHCGLDDLRLVPAADYADAQNALLLRVKYLESHLAADHQIEQRFEAAEAELEACLARAGEGELSAHQRWLPMTLLFVGTEAIYFRAPDAPTLRLES